MRDSWKLVAAPLMGLAGLAAVIGAVIYWFINGQFNLNVQMPLAAGLLLLTAFAALAIDQVQTWLGARQFRYGANAVAVSLMVLAILVIVNYLAKQGQIRIGANTVKIAGHWDLTENQQFTLAPQTKDVLQSLPAEVHAYAFYSSNLGSYREEAQGLLEEYKFNGNGLFTYEIIDPVLQPSRAQNLGVTSNATVVFVLGDKKETTTYGGEQEFTSALIRLTSAGPRVVYFIAGHGERDPEDAGSNGFSQVRTGLEDQNYTVKALNLLVTDTIPSDATAIVVASPLTSLNITETQVISNYLGAGGKAVFLFDPVSQPTGEPADPLLDYLQAEWGLQVNDDVVVDPASSQVTDPFVPVAADYGSSPITDKLNRLATAYPVARTISSTNPAAGIITVALVKTSDAAWGETDLLSLQNGNPQKDAGVDAAGPLSLAYTAENTNSDARVVVFGDSDFATNNGAQWPGNRDMFLNALNWSAEQENLVSIAPKSGNEGFRQPIDASARTMNTIFLLAVIVFPGGVLLLGVGVWWQRRRHA